MKTLIVLATLALGLSAQAEGFKCQTESGLSIQVYNHTKPYAGTRSAAIMVVSNDNYYYGNQTIAKFTDLKGTLSSKSLRYVGEVDLRVAESNRKGELIAGTKLGYVRQVVLDIIFSYARPVAAGQRLPAMLTIVKRNGTLIEEAAVCERYLKN